MTAKKLTKRELTCAFCGGASEGNCSIHRKGFGYGTEVWLCDSDGLSSMPSCEQIWDNLRGKKLPDSAFVDPKERRKR